MNTKGYEVSLPGLEVDNLLAFLALLGLLRALEHSRPRWAPQSGWDGPPWTARLRLAHDLPRDEIAAAAAEGVEAVAARYDVDARANVKFTRDEYRAYTTRLAGDAIGSRLAAAISVEWPMKRAGDGTQAGPFVMMFGQGHQNFLDRLIAIPRGELPNRLRKRKPAPDMRDPTKVAEALFEPWRRTDDADGFRWDPNEDQRYALRHGDPSAAGAAPTVHGANRLAAIGLLSFPCMPGLRRLTAPGVARDREGISFIWPVWRPDLSLRAIEALLSHPGVVAGRLEKVRALGVADILRARRVANGKFMNVTRASSFAS